MVYYLLNMYKYEESKLSRIFLLLSKINDINGNYLMVVFIESQTMYNLLLFNSIQLISNIFCFLKIARLSAFLRLDESSFYNYIFQLFPRNPRKVVLFRYTKKKESFGASFSWNRLILKCFTTFGDFSER